MVTLLEDICVCVMLASQPGWPNVIQKVSLFWNNAAGCITNSTAANTLAGLH